MEVEVEVDVDTWGEGGGGYIVHCVLCAPLQPASLSFLWQTGQIHVIIGG